VAKGIILLGGNTFYIVSVFLSFVAGVLVTLLLINGRIVEALLTLGVSFVIVSFNEKTGAFERLIDRRSRRKLKPIGILLLWLMIMLVVALVLQAVIS